MTDEIKNKIYNIELVVEDIKKFPQTYDSILKDLRKDGTCQTILRRKLSSLHKRGEVCKTKIPGTRFGKIIFYCFEKKYHILIEAGRMGSEVFCFFEYKKLSKYYMEIKKGWRLVDGDWNKISNKRFFHGDILKWI